LFLLSANGSSTDSDSGIMCEILGYYVQYFWGTFTNYVWTMHAIYPVIYYIAGMQTLKTIFKLIQIINTAVINTVI